MRDYVSNLDIFLRFNEYQILKNAGKVSNSVAKQLAEDEYEKFRVVQDRKFESDFDREVKKVMGRKK
ncbi:MAG: virulence RhuM family protein [Nitrospinae bacterium]|nr:virulence RhuM family protein [Nitrospinota bacterium]